MTKYFLIILAAFLLTSPVLAELKIYVTGELVEDLCIVNNNETISVDFGSNLQVNTINGDNFITDIDYTLSCYGLASNDLQMQFEGTETSFSNDFLATDREGLGIKIYMNSKVMPLNTWEGFTWPEKPRLQAAPVKRDGHEVDVGFFSASATLKIQYQ